MDHQNTKTHMDHQNTKTHMDHQNTKTHMNQLEHYDTHEPARTLRHTWTS